MFPPSQCLTSTGQGCRPLSPLHRCVLVLQLFWRCGLEESEFVQEYFWQRSSGCYLRVRLCVVLICTRHRRKQMMAVCVHSYRGATASRERACVNISSAAPRNHPLWCRIQGISPGMRVTATLQWAERRDLKSQMCSSKTHCHLLAALSSQKCSFV